MLSPLCWQLPGVSLTPPSSHRGRGHAHLLSLTIFHLPSWSSEAPPATLTYFRYLMAVLLCLVSDGAWTVLALLQRRLGFSLPSVLQPRSIRNPCPRLSRKTMRCRLFSFRCTCSSLVLHSPPAGPGPLPCACSQDSGRVTLVGGAMAFFTTGASLYPLQGLSSS